MEIGPTGTKRARSAKQQAVVLGYKQFPAILLETPENRHFYRAMEKRTESEFNSPRAFLVK